MTAPRVLVVYGTTHGQTEKVARRIAEALTADGVAVTTSRVEALAQTTSAADFDGVIVGASVRYGRHQRAVRDFVRARVDAMNALPSAFVSVSGAAGSALPDEQAEAQRCVEQFLADTRWTPHVTETFGGALAYTRYDPITRWLMRRISRRRGGPTDTSRDHESTDWGQVERFAHAFAQLLPHAAETTSLASGD